MILFEGIFLEALNAVLSQCVKDGRVSWGVVRIFWVYLYQDTSAFRARRDVHAGMHHAQMNGLLTFSPVTLEFVSSYVRSSPASPASGFQASDKKDGESSSSEF